MNQEKKFFGFGKNVTVAGLVSFFMDVSSEMIYPLVPIFLANVMGVNNSVIGLIESVLAFHDPGRHRRAADYFFYHGT